MVPVGEREELKDADTEPLGLLEPLELVVALLHSVVVAVPL